MTTAHPLPTESHPETLIPYRDLPAELVRLTAANEDLERRLAASIRNHNADLRAASDNVRDYETKLARAADRAIEQTAVLHDEITALRRERSQLLSRVGEVERERDHYRAVHQRGLEIGRAGAASEIDVLRARCEALAARCADYHAALCELLAEHGTDCDECGGSGLVMDEEPGFDPGSRDGYYSRRVEVPCDACFSGRVAKGGAQ